MNKKELEKDAAKRVLKEYKETKQDKVDKDNPNADKTFIEKCIEILKGKEK